MEKTRSSAHQYSVVATDFKDILYYIWVTGREENQTPNIRKRQRNGNTDYLI